MKKFLVLALAIVMALSVVALVACAQEEIYEGEYHYNSHSTEYGCKVKVYVKGNTITKVELLSDAESGYVRTTTGWKPTEEGGYGMAEGDLGYAATEAAYADYLNKTFKGKTVEEVKAYTVSISGVEDATANSVPADVNLAGATQSAARIIRAIQNALKDVK